jgi:hypothetical protein
MQGLSVTAVSIIAVLNSSKEKYLFFPLLTTLGGAVNL